MNLKIITMHPKSALIFACLLISVAALGCPPIHAADDQLAEFVSRNKQLVIEYDRILPMTESSSGDIRQLMENRLANLEQSILLNMDRMVIEITKRGAGDVASKQALQIASDWVGEFVPVIISRAEEQDRRVRELLLQEPPADPQATLALETRLRRELNQLMDWYEALHRLSSNMKILQVSDSQVDEHLREKLPELAALLASGISLAIERIDDVRFILSLMPKSEQLRQQETVAELQLDNTATTLSRTADLLEELKLPTADYRSLVIQVTGEISSDVFSLSVLRALLGQWTYDFRSWASTSGPKTLFKVLLFTLITVAAWVLSRLTRRMVERGIKRFQLTRLLKNLMISTAANIVLALGVLVALSQVGVSLGPLLAGLGVIGFIVGFALQETLGNFASGMMILMYRPFDEGDVVEVSGVLGQVHKMSLVSTVILTPDNQELVIPNNRIWGNVIRNVYAQKNRRVDLEFSISYEDDLRTAEEVFRDVLAGHSAVLTDPAPTVKVHQLAESAVVFAVRPWVKSPDYWDTYWDINREVKLRLVEAGIVIPYPHRKVHLVDARPENAI